MINSRVGQFQFCKKLKLLIFVLNKFVRDQNVKNKWAADGDLTCNLAFSKQLIDSGNMKNVSNAVESLEMPSVDR